jgi:acyl-CoA synthetase (AMP-forming)/AMP-acid ligase II
MNIAMLLEMTASADGERVAVGTMADGWSAARLLDAAARAATDLRGRGVPRVLYGDVATPTLPVALFGSSWAGAAFVPVSYRLADDRLRDIVARQAPALILVGEGTEHRVAGIDGVEVLTTGDWLAGLDTATPADTDWSFEGDDVAILLHTSGTSGDPKVAVLRQKHLVSYVLGSVEFLSAGPDEATLVTVPPYHIAGMAAILTATYSGRRLVQLPNFEPVDWVRVARREAVTHAMVVPTMLARINDVIAADGGGLPALRHLSYGGGRMPLPVIEHTLRLLPHVNFVNAYGLTETSSSIAVLGPDEHREAIGSDDPAVRARLGSVGRPLPGVEISVCDLAGDEVGPNVVGEVWVRGEQVSGEYAHASALDRDGWFPTNDGGYFDAAGYLYVTGRLDDVIVRGGENLSPGEIEDVLLHHPAVHDACVLGVPDDEWGEAVAAVVVLEPGRAADEEELASWVVSHLRSSRRPVRIEFRDALPMNDTGKVLRRVLRAELTG